MYKSNLQDLPQAPFQYVMEHAEEHVRLEMKTDFRTLEKQALWAGLQDGMRVADIGCGSGKTSSFLQHLVGPDGEVVGLDASVERIAYAREKYCGKGIRFLHQQLNRPLNGLGPFDFIWVRFFLEYNRSQAAAIIAALSQLLAPSGILCLIDLDNNCLSHFGMSDRLSTAIQRVVDYLTQHHDFDPYAGRKLYSYLFDLQFRDIDVHMEPHHLIFGTLEEAQRYTWLKKLEIAARKSGSAFSEFPGGYEEFAREFTEFFSSSRRFTYTPVISCRGRRP